MCGGGLGAVSVSCHTFTTTQIEKRVSEKNRSRANWRKEKRKDYYILYLQNLLWKTHKANMGCSQIVKTPGSRRAGSWKIDSEALKKPLKQECSDDLFYNAERVSGETVRCQCRALTQGHLLTPLLWRVKRYEQRKTKGWGTQTVPGWRCWRVEVCTQVALTLLTHSKLYKHLMHESPSKSTF